MRIAKPNRDRTHIRLPHAKGWCMVCDMALVPEGQKCHVCGKRSLSKKTKMRSKDVFSVKDIERQVSGG